MWCVPQLTPLFRERKDDILALYTEPLPAGHELHCFDEVSKQLLGTPRGGQPCAPGTVRRLDYEYKRNGTRNLFVAVNPLVGERTVAVTERRTAADTANFLWHYCMEEHRTAAHIHLVLDNLNTHLRGSLTKVWGDQKTAAFFARVTLHHTPTHASWLNMAECEISCLKTQGLKTRLADEAVLKNTVAAITAWRNQHRRKITWTFTTKKAQEKFPELYRELGVVN